MPKKKSKTMKCPKCENPGTPARRWVRNSTGKRYEYYLSITHWDKETKKYHSCYIGKEKPRR